ncbi:hypothetical protein GOBAR_AA19755 [Gossypium barbadense]|uniref:Uncharacterized protein n=1 Tax=Gossypium barbadense TaxID=3634 RepID=A0A2P5XC48_GOSBA|nr:hypothetical protein GOBAR_AA19755 [Gossypium barbadense]
MKLLPRFKGFRPNGGSPDDNQEGSEDTPSGTNSLSRELNETIDIDSLVGGVRKKCNTTVEVVCISSGCFGALSPSSFLLANLPSSSPTTSSLIIVVDDTSSPTARVSPSVPVIREMSIEGLNARSCKAKQHAITPTIKPLLLSTIFTFQGQCDWVKVVVGPFDVHEMDLGAPKGVDRSSLGFDVSSSLSVVWESFVSTWRSSPDFYIKKDPIANEDVVPSIANNNVTHSNDVYQGIDRDNMP